MITDIFSFQGITQFVVFVLLGHYKETWTLFSALVSVFQLNFRVFQLNFPGYGLKLGMENRNAMLEMKKVGFHLIFHFFPGKVAMFW